MSTECRKIYNTITTTAVASTTKHVVSKLTSLVETECYKLSSLRDDVDFMRKELNSMHALLDKLDGGSARGVDNDAQVREWREEVRRLSADIEACVADFKRLDDDDDDGGGDGDGKSGQPRGNAVAAFFRGNAHKVATVGARHSIGGRIKKLKARINDINERRKRYNLDHAVNINC